MTNENQTDYRIEDDGQVDNSPSRIEDDGQENINDRDEVKRLQGMYASAVAGRAAFRDALRQCQAKLFARDFENDVLKQAIHALSKPGEADSAIIAATENQP